MNVSRLIRTGLFGLLALAVAGCTGHVRGPRGGSIATAKGPGGTRVTKATNARGGSVTTVKGPRGGKVTTVQTAGGHKATFIKKGPPPPKVMKLRPRRPSLRHIWIPGHWSMQSGKWSWKSGRWLLRPRKKAKWQRAKWVHIPGQGWKFTPGHWK